MVNITQNALKLWATQLVPSLLPFMILTNLFTPYVRNLILKKERKKHSFSYRFLGLSAYGTYIFLIGQLSGYPIGAKLTADAYSKNYISKSEANYLLTICNQSSPAFLEFYVGAFALQNKIKLTSLFIIFYSSVFMTSILTKKLYKPISTPDQIHISAESTTTFFQKLDCSILDSVKTLIRIAGYILFFSLLAELFFPLTHIKKELYYLPAASLELTNGLSILKTHYSKFGIYNYLVLSLTAFGGFCTMAQIKGMLLGTFLSIKPYLIGKIIYTFTVLLTYLLFSNIQFFF